MKINGFFAVLIVVACLAGSCQRAVELDRKEVTFAMDNDEMKQVLLQTLNAHLDTTYERLPKYEYADTENREYSFELTTAGAEPKELWASGTVKTQVETYKLEGYTVIMPRISTISLQYDNSVLALPVINWQPTLIEGAETVLEIEQNVQVALYAKGTELEVSGNAAIGKPLNLGGTQALIFAKHWFHNAGGGINVEFEGGRSKMFSSMEALQQVLDVEFDLHHSENMVGMGKMKEHRGKSSPSGTRTPIAIE